MAHFFGTLHNAEANRKPATKCGTAKGLASLTTGWAAGVRVLATVEEGRDTFRVYLTEGNGSKDQKEPGTLLATVTHAGVVLADWLLTATAERTISILEKAQAQEMLDLQKQGFEFIGRRVCKNTADL